MKLKNMMKEFLKLGGTAATSAVIAYYFDSNQGKRRRILVRDKVGKLQRELHHQSQLALNDVKHRLQGRIYEISARLSEQDQDDHTIHERVRSVIGHYCSHPKAIQVNVENQEVTLKGEIFHAEAKPLLWAVSSVRGVKRVINQLSVHEEAENVPSLQGGQGKLSYAVVNREYWPPAYRFGFGILGTLMSINGMIKRDFQGNIGALVGGLLLTRSIANKSLKRFLGIGAGPQLISLKKSITIKAPLDKVSEVWRHPESFPTFMRNVHHVEKIDEGRYRWFVRGLAGMEFEWVITMEDKKDQNRITWRSIPGSIIEQMGSVYFEPRGDELTTAHISFSYNPPAGALGHLIALIFHSDPKTDLDQDMLRLKSMIETGKAPHDAHMKSA